MRQTPDTPTTPGSPETSEIPGVADAQRDALRIEFAGSWYVVKPGETFDIGREADLSVDDNRYLHRRFLRFVYDHRFWWIVNIGARTSATLCDATGGANSWLPPGARLPIVFSRTTLVFTAGPTTYELMLHLDSPAYLEPPVYPVETGSTTAGSIVFTPTQRLAILALAEPMLRREGVTVTEIPTSKQAADRLGWKLTMFSRKLDNVCDKLDRAGVRGLRGGRGHHATNRRARLVEYAVSTRLVTPEDLHLLDQAASLDEDS